jgi:hypothetical protein
MAFFGQWAHQSARFGHNFMEGNGFNREIDMSRFNASNV